MSGIDGPLNTMPYNLHEQYVTAGTFDKVERLIEYLHHHHVDTHEWGEAAKTKRVEDLFMELQSREITLQLVSGKCFRCVSLGKILSKFCQNFVKI